MGSMSDNYYIPEEDFDVTQGGQVEVIGWLHQYYNTEPKNEASPRKARSQRMRFRQ